MLDIPWWTRHRRRAGTSAGARGGGLGRRCLPSSNVCFFSSFFLSSPPNSITPPNLHRKVTTAVYLYDKDTKRWHRNSILFRAAAASVQVISDQLAMKGTPRVEKWMARQVGRDAMMSAIIQVTNSLVELGFILARLDRRLKVFTFGVKRCFPIFPFYKISSVGFWIVMQPIIIGRYQLSTKSWQYLSIGEHIEVQNLFCYCTP